MRNGFAIRLLAVGLFLVTAGAITRANATPPPPKGWYGAFRVPAIVCDTKEQIEAIVKAGLANHDTGAKTKYVEYAHVLNAKSEPTCAIVLTGMVAVGESEPLGIYYHSTGRVAPAFAVHIGNSQAENWLLYIDLDTPMQGASYQIEEPTWSIFDLFI